MSSINPTNKNNRTSSLLHSSSHEEDEDDYGSPVPPSSPPPPRDHASSVDLSPLQQQNENQNGYTDFVLSDEEFLDDDLEEEEEHAPETPSLPLPPPPPPPAEDGSPAPEIAITPPGLLDDDEVDEGSIADDESVVAAQNRQRRRSGVRSPRRGFFRKQQDEEDAMMIDDKPWRSGGRPRRLHRRNRTTGSSGTPGEVVVGSERNHPLQQQQGASSSLLRYLRSWGKQGGGDEGLDQSTSHSKPQETRHVKRQSAPELSVEYSSDDQSVSSEDDDEGEESVDSWQEVLSDEEGFPEEALIAWDALPALPHSFQGNLPDPSLSFDPFTRETGQEVSWEHGMLLRAVMQLLAVRDQVGVEGSLDSEDNIHKRGPLKKMSYVAGRRGGTWKVKYVELRTGNLCYYEDSGPTSGRKTIHLRKANAVVQESSLTGPGYVFELFVQGSPVRYWMAHSVEERQAWMRAIEASMIGDDVQHTNDSDMESHKLAAELFSSLHQQLARADTLELYLGAIQGALEQDVPLQVPVQWIRRQSSGDQSSFDLSRSKMLQQSHETTAQKRLQHSISQFWRNMADTHFSLNGVTIPRHSPMSSERMVGALTRAILEYDKLGLLAQEQPQDEENAHVTELQAVSYARRILLAVLRSKEQQDAAVSVKYLLENADLVIVSQTEDDPVVHMEVSIAGQDFFASNSNMGGDDEVAGWLWTTRRTALGKWRRRFAVLSGSVLSHYDHESPRPHGLRGQLVLDSGTTVQEVTDAPATNSFGSETTTSASTTNTNSSANSGGAITKDEKRRFVLSLTPSQGQVRLLAFEEESHLMTWKEMIQRAIDNSSMDSNKAVNDANNDSTTALTATGGAAGSISPRSAALATPSKIAPAAKLLVKGAERVIKVAADGGIRGGIRVIKSAKSSGIKVIRTATGGGIKVIRGAVGMVRRTKGGGGGVSSTLEEEDLGSRQGGPSVQMLLHNASVPGKREPTVQCVVQTNYTFSLMTPGMMDDSLLMSVQAKLYQAFIMSGGSSGRIGSGSTLIELEFVETNAAEEEDEA